MPSGRRIDIRGTVQGVGFRPFIYRLARAHGLHGWVANTARGARLEIEGKPKSITAFLQQLRTDLPGNACITSLKIQSVSPKNFTSFSIVNSIGAPEISADLPPDLTVCPDCFAELFAPGDRRYRYPFINCTSCGPRFSIVKTLPYDRPKTTMADFRLCPACRKEYRAPSDRRFHAQPNACPVCGPQVTLYDRNFKELSIRDTAVQTAVELLKRGAIVAVKGMGGYHLACDALNGPAVRRLRLRKNRPDKPFALMVPDLAAARILAELNAQEAALLESPQRPIVLLKKKTAVPNVIAPGNAYVGIMLPGTPLHYLFFAEYLSSPLSSVRGKRKAVSGKPLRVLIMTSGNRRDEPICRDETAARTALTGIAEYFLAHDRPIHNRCDDSILAAGPSKPIIVRRSRGIVPKPVRLSAPAGTPTIFAAGAELKNTFCLTRGDRAYVSPYIGDLDHAETQEFYRESFDRFSRYLKVKPSLIVHDLHPDYHSTRFARTLARRVPTLAVQHHHAHAASVMAEHGIAGPAIAFVFDGTGYGEDGTIWGGECLLLNGPSYRRLAHIEPFPLPGGETAIREPWRIATALCRQAGFTTPGHLKARPLDTIAAMIARGINSPLCSSVGRLFDGIAALSGLRQTVSFEAQAAMELEAAAMDNRSKKGYNFTLNYNTNPVVAGIKSLIAGVLKDTRERKSAAVISARFHNGLARLVEDLAVRFSKTHGTRRILLSGGCFQNRLLLKLCVERLGHHGLTPYYNTVVPPNDGGISLGQAWVAQQQLRGFPCVSPFPVRLLN